MTPKTIVEEKQQINYHATRILLLIAFAGSPKNTPMIKGRTLLAKFDFFLRYPAYLGRAVKIRTGRELEDLLDYEINNVETRMVRYKYGPWDHIYYSVLTYLVSKDLISVTMKKNVEYFGLTKTGEAKVRELSSIEIFQSTIKRAQVIKKIFPGWSGSSVKEFIYQRFPEIVSLPLGEDI